MLIFNGNMVTRTHFDIKVYTHIVCLVYAITGEQHVLSLSDRKVGNREMALVATKPIFMEQRGQGTTSLSNVC